jgi:fibronectin-binding autotransporter adhesin
MNKKAKHLRKLRKLMLFSSTLLAASSANADDYWWDSNGVTAGFGSNDGTWGSSTFWSTSSAGTDATANTTITSADTVNFGTASLAYGTSTRSVAIASGGVEVGSIVIGAAQNQAINLGTAGNNLTLHSGITKNSGSAVFTINSPIVLGGSQTWTNNSSTSLVWGGGLNLGTNTLTFAGSGNFQTTAGAFSATAGNIIHSGTGQVILRNGSAYTGTTTISGGGTFMLSGKSSGNYHISNGVLTDYYRDSYVFSSGLGSGNNQIQITGGTSGFGAGNGTSQWTIGAANSSLTWGSAHFDPTTLRFFTNGDNMGPSTFGIVQFNNGLNLNGATRTIDVLGASGGSAALINSRAIITGSITGTSGSVLTKTEAGNLQLNGSNTYVGGTNINAGMVLFNTLTSMPASGTVTVANGAILGVTVAGSGTTWGGGSGVAGIAGLTSTANGGEGFGGQTGAVVDFNGNSSLLLNVTGNVTESNAIGNGSATSISLIKQGSSTLTLSGNNTFTGSVTVNAGTLNLSGSNTFSSATVNTGTLILAGSNTLSGAISVAQTQVLQLQHANATNGATSVTLNNANNSIANATVLNLRNNSVTTFATNVTFASSGTSFANVNVDRVSAGSGNQLTLNGFSTTQNHGNVASVNMTGGNGYTLNIGTYTINRGAGGGSGAGHLINPTSTSVTIGSINVASNVGGLALFLGGTSTGNSTGAITNTGSALRLEKQGASTWRLTGSSNYGGTTTLTGGILEVSVMANGGSNSSLGNSGNVASNLLVGNGTTLRYVGSTDATTNRAFTINGTAAGHDATIESSGVGTLTFNTPATGLAYGTNNQTRTLTLGGTNTGANTFGKILSNNGTGATSLVKSGTGTWVVNQANTHTGGTTVSAGTLLVNNSSGSGTGSGSVSVAVGATLGGTGTISGNTTISGLHSPGNSPGIQNFGGALSYETGSSVLWELVANNTVVRGTDFDGIDVTGALSFNGATTINLDFDFGASAVEWNDSFWNTDKTGTSGWLIYSGASSLAGFSNLSLNASSFWTDENGDLLSAARGNASFSLIQDGNNIYLNYSAIPEPSSFILGGLGLLGLLRRRRA